MCALIKGIVDFYLISIKLGITTQHNTHLVPEHAIAQNTFQYSAFKQGDE